MIYFLDFNSQTGQNICAFKWPSSNIMVAETEAAPNGVS
jgi:hypothetical protein